MKKLMIAVIVTGVVVAGAIIKTIHSVKGSDKESLPEPEKSHELTSDFLL